MVTLLTRRQFGLGASALLGTATTGSALAQGSTRTVTTLLGTYDIPTAPKRVVAIDPRTDYEAALVLGLPIIAVGASTFWGDFSHTPRAAGLTEIALPTTSEAVLALEPDLIICSGEDPTGEWWPAERMQRIAPVLTTTFSRRWQDDLRELAGWVDRVAAAEKAIARYDTRVADLKARYGAVLDGSKIAVITYNAEYREFSAFTPGPPDDADPKEQLMADLGVKTIERSLLADGTFSMENMGDLLADVDAILLCNMGMGGLGELDQDPLWARVPAVAAGRVYESSAYMWYGSYYTAMKAVEEMDRLLEVAG